MPVTERTAECIDRIMECVSKHINGSSAAIASDASADDVRALVVSILDLIRVTVDLLGDKAASGRVADISASTRTIAAAIAAACYTVGYNDGIKAGSDGNAVSGE